MSTVFKNLHGSASFCYSKQSTSSFESLTRPMGVLNHCESPLSSSFSIIGQNRFHRSFAQPLQFIHTQFDTNVLYGPSGSLSKDNLCPMEFLDYGSYIRRFFGVLRKEGPLHLTDVPPSCLWGFIVSTLYSLTLTRTVCTLRWPTELVTL